jgi:hypothetical protein
MEVKQRKPRTMKPKRTATELLNDRSLVTVSVSQASLILGIGRTTAHNAYKRTGYLTDGVPVLRVGKRVVVSLTHLRSALGFAEPEQLKTI